MAGRRALLVATVLVLGVAVVNGRRMVCTSRGDTHMSSFEGRRFNAMGSGIWRMAKTSDRFFELQVEQVPWVQRREDVTVDRSLAQRCGPFIFEANGKSDKTPGILSVNKEKFTLKGRENRVWEAPPTADRPYKTVMKVTVHRADTRLHHFRVECRSEKAGVEPTVIYTDVWMNGIRYGRRQVMYSNVHLTFQNSPYKDGDFTGLCGMTPDEEDNKKRANNCERIGFTSAACKAIVVAKAAEDLAADLKVVIKAAKAGAITLDAKRLAQKREHCMTLVAKVVPNLEDVPPALRKELVEAAADCAYDTYFGLPSSTKGMEDALCGFGQEQVDIMRFKAAEQYREMRCLFTPDNAMGMKGSGDMDSLRERAEKISQAIACTQSTIDEFSFEGCEVKATAGLEGSAASKKCGSEGDGGEEEEPTGPIEAVGPPPDFLQLASRLRAN